MNTEINNDVDVVIIGGGVAGCIAAIALAESYHVVLIDKLDQPVERIGECLPPAARRILRRLDLLDGLESAVPPGGQSPHLKNIGTRSYWGKEQVQIVDHLRNPDGFGWHLDRRGFETYLRKAALKRGVNCVWPAKLHDAHYENLYWHITAEPVGEASKSNDYCYRAKFVIDASGRQSHFARKSGVQRQHFDKLIACWATLPDFEQNKMSTISASELGWWYSAPLPNNKRVLALQTDSDLIDRREIKNVSQFIKLAQANSEVAKIIEHNQGGIEFHQTVAANSTRLNQVAGQQWAALGDAAISFDPLSSQGMFNAMAGAMQLAEMLIVFGLIENPGSKNMVQFQNAYTYQIDQIWSHYINHKKTFYRQEMRWKESVFWKRRHDD
ncbi:NAD(P)/FAD-dependent oxidoreductase [Mucilaginibacter flavidus]|uniref:NAD(P)/FAD-dependent oxidoreductase n=1 Tax=Mucilaginibacter flavidus TaxID=2949309 RepID=UPI002092DDCB|nr:tryptophan 7-halogenase [Mucilaginibacter flavidus]MCO5948519.1 tryptophan 7-halogenase [Mucilaginibacter flavidus]